MPRQWHEAFVSLLPKPHEAPTCPGNLRPISVLPAVSKILARIAAQRIRPLLEQALASQPQYAYLIARRTTDALDRVYDHCEQARQQVASVRPDPFLHSKRRSSSLRGGLQLSLDLSRAFDKLPRSKLSQALHRIRAPPDLIQLILYLHQEMILVFRRGDLSTELLTGAGIRQGCGLAPLIWCAYSLLILEQFETYLHRHQITAFADDLHLNWIITAPMQFRQACIHIGKILDDLRDFGMSVAFDKTVILLLLGGSSHATAVRGRICRAKAGRQLPVSTANGPVRLPIKREHVYLGVKIGYGSFERATVAYRIQQSWQAFNRLHRALICQALLCQFVCVFGQPAFNPS